MPVQVQDFIIKQFQIKLSIIFLQNSVLTSLIVLGPQILFNILIGVKFNKSMPLFLVFLLTMFASSFAQNFGSINQYQPSLLNDQVLSAFTIKTNAFSLNTLLTADSLLITLKDFQDWAVYMRQYTDDDIGSQIDKSFGLRDITQKLECHKSISNEGQTLNEYKYGQIITDNEKPCFRVQKSGLVVTYLLKKAQTNMRSEQKIYQIQLKLIRIRSMTKLEIQKVRSQVLSQNVKTLKNQSSQKIKLVKEASQIKDIVEDSLKRENGTKSLNEGKKVQQTVFNLINDSRKTVDLVYPFPYSTIGIVEVKRSGSRTQGTGFLIAPNVVMTAAHNLYEKKSKEQIKSIIFWLGVIGIQGKKFQIKKYYFPQKFKNQTKQSVSFDYCLLILEEKAEANYGFLSVDWSGKNIGQIQIAGYPAFVYKEGVQQKAQNKIHIDKGRCQKDKQSQGMIRYQVQTSSGQSGSPIITKLNGQYSVIGIHTIGQQSFNQGVLLSNKIKAELTQWLIKEKIDTTLASIETNSNSSTKIKKKDEIEQDGKGNVFKEDKGTERYENGDNYEGEFKQGKKHGRGTVFSENGKFEGVWQNGFRQKGIFTEKNGSIWQVQYTYRGSGEVIQTWSQKGVQQWRYNGLMKNEKKNGLGIETWSNGDQYIANYIDGKKQGKGTFKAHNGDRYEGEFKNNKAEGKGTFYWADGSRYEGQYKNGKKEGYGSFYWPDGRKQQGEFKNGNRHGKIIYYENGGKYEEYWQDGVGRSSQKYD